MTSFQLGIYAPPRRATVDDSEVVAQHRARMFADMGTAPAQVESIARESTQWFREALASGAYLGWLVVLRDVPTTIVAGAGMLLMNWPPTHRDVRTRRGYILNVYTEPEHRRRGLARLLTIEVLDEARRRDIGIVTLHASEQGRQLYESLGFQDTNEMRLEFGRFSPTPPLE